MPECVEVERALRAVRPALLGSRLTRYRSRHHCFREALPPLVVERAHRHGKWILLSDGRATVRMHLGMSGSLVLGGPVRDHARWTLVLERGDGRRQLLQFVDPRCMGRLDVLDAVGTRLLMASQARARGCPTLGLGPDVLSRAMTTRDDVDLRSRWRALLNVTFDVKSALMAQHIVAGLGNIYATEACWIARCSPYRIGRDLTAQQIRLLAEGIPALLARSTKLGGTSLGDANSFRVNGRPGRMRAELRAYGRAGLPCRRCGGTIVREQQKGRSTHWCPGCQT